MREKQLRVCHLASGDLWAGAEVQLFLLLKTLQDRRGLDLALVVLNEGELADRTRALGIPTVVLDESRKGFARIRRDLADHIRADPPLILHSHRYKENILAASVRGSADPLALVQTVHGLTEAPSGFQAIKAGLTGRLNRLVMKRYFQKVIPVSREIGTRLSAFLPPERMRVIHNGIDLPTLEAKLPIQVVRRDLGFPDGSKVVGVAGRMVPIKGFDVFLKAMARVVKVFPEARGVLIGDGPLLGELSALADRLGLAGTVNFVGFRADIVEYLNALDLFVISSHHEGIPTVLLEAMGLGKPVLSTSVGGILEVLDGDRFGRTVPPDDPAALGDGILELLRDVESSAEIGREGRERINTAFSSRQMGDRVMDLYMEVIGQQ